MKIRHALLYTLGAAALTIGTTACGPATTGPDWSPKDPWATDTSRGTPGGTSTTGTGGTPTPAPGVVDRITLNMAGACVLQGYTITSVATVSHRGVDGVWRAADASDVQWTIGDPTVAQINTTHGSQTVVKGLRQGATILTASVLGQRATAQIFVSGTVLGAPLNCSG